jgi:hypothetical protein
MIKEYTIKRVYLPTETLGSMFDPKGSLVCKTMELPWKDNRRSISCIPEGRYLVNKMPPIPKDDPATPEDESGGRKPRNYGHFRFPAVVGRSGILIHRITYVKDLQGCIGVGNRFHDFNNDGVPDMAESSSALSWMYDNMPDQFYLNITKK